MNVSDSDPTNTILNAIGLMTIICVIYEAVRRAFAAIRPSNNLRVISTVGADSITARQHAPILLYCLPGELGYFISKDIDIFITEASLNALDNTLGFQSADDAVCAVEDVAAGLVLNIKPQNLFLVFSERTEALQTAFAFFESREFLRAGADHKRHQRGPAYQTESIAVLLCKLAKTEELQKLFRGDQRHAAKDGGYYQVTWAEFKQLYQVGDHAADANNQPTPAQP
jgi:hypothetical protein